MQREDFIAITICCSNYNIEVSLLHSFSDSGLIIISIFDEAEFIHRNQLKQLEKILNLHQQLDINLPGIETVLHLLEKIERMQQEITTLKNQLAVHEVS
jgi:hypothetical protein